ncbi:MAG: hypothetical protein WCS69_00815 [Ignavibacteriaceae bacterium]|jgi:hypothetical protein
MKALIFVFSISLFVCQIVSAQYADITIDSYDINTTVLSNSEAIDVKLICNISVRNNSNAIQFIFSSESSLHSIKHLRDEKWINLPFVFAGKDSITITNPEKFFKDTKYALQFAYSFPTSKLNDTLLALDRGNRWYPMIIDQIVPFKLSCEVSKNYEVISSGDLLEITNFSEKSTYVWESRLPVFKIPLIIYNPAIFKKSTTTLANFYYLSIDSTKALKLLTDIGEAINYYNNILGPFPYKKISLIEIQDFPGINTGSGLLMVGTQSLEAAGNGYDDMLILTIAQQWFGAGVFARFGEKGFLFLSLSLPHYLRLMFIRQNWGEEAFNESLNDPLNRYKKFAGKENDIPIIDVDLPNTKEKGLILYAKGPFVFSKIENELGYGKWLSFLHDLYQNFCGKILTYDEFKDRLKKYDEEGKVLTLLNHLMTEKGIVEK